MVPRLAIGIETRRGGSWFFDTNDHVVALHIVVYDTGTGRQLARFAISPKNYGPGGGPGIGLSPDGHVVAAAKVPYSAIEKAASDPQPHGPG